MKKSPFYFVLISLLISCKPKAQDTTGKKQLTHIKNFSFYSGFMTGNRQIESFNSMEYFCVGDYRTHKKIALHSLSDTSKYFIDLS